MFQPGNVHLREASRYEILPAMRKSVVIVVKSLVALLLASSVVLAVFMGWLIWHYEYGIGLPDNEKLAAVSAAGKICSSGGKRTFVPLTEIPSLLRSAVLAYEEPDFYDRPSINSFTEPVFRQSNISISVTRCLMSLSPGCCRGLDWHIGNAILMNRVARTLSRDRILEIYMNEQYFGRGAYGVAAAAAAYFGKSLTELSVDETAFIAALPRAPALLGRNKDRGVERRNVVIDRMLQAGAVSGDQAISAKERPLVLQDQTLSDRSRQDSL
jgi:membrane carboxypeptidase/penicillin-binding protein